MTKDLSHYAVVVHETWSDLAHEVVVKDLGAIVDDILDESGTTTIAMTSDLTLATIEAVLCRYLGDDLLHVMSGHQQSLES